MFIEELSQSEQLELINNTIRKMTGFVTIMYADEILDKYNTKNKYKISKLLGLKEGEKFVVIYKKATKVKEGVLGFGFSGRVYKKGKFFLKSKKIISAVKMSDYGGMEVWLDKKLLKEEIFGETNKKYKEFMHKKFGEEYLKGFAEYVKDKAIKQEEENIR